MIISVTPNPAVDQTVWIDRLEPGQVHRTTESQLDPAGKGVNVSRMVHRLGWPTVAFGFLAGETGHIIRNSLDEEGVQHHFVQVPGRTRISTTIVEPSRSTSLFGGGPRIGPEHRAALEGLLGFWIKAARVVVLAGSMPPGLPLEVYAHWVGSSRTLGVKVVLDARGEALEHGLRAGADLVKPNLAEAEELLGRPLRTLEAALEGAHDIAAIGGGEAIVVLSLGEHGAVAVQGRQAWRAVPPRVPHRSTVGSGDSMVAGMAVALAKGDTLPEGLRLGSAAGAATAMTPGTTLGSARDVQALLPRVQVTELEVGLPAQTPLP